MSIFRTTLPTPFGDIHVAVDDDGVLIEVCLPNRAGPTTTSPRPMPAAATAGMNEARTQLTEYFNAKRRTFYLRLDARGTAFERSVWDRLRAIPYGQTQSYGTIADELGLVNGARAVGRANGANPIPIVIPCHRVIGSDGQLTRLGGGLPLKRALLELEGALPPPDLLLF